VGNPKVVEKSETEVKVVIKVEQGREPEAGEDAGSKESPFSAIRHSRIVFRRAAFTQPPHSPCGEIGSPPATVYPAGVRLTRKEMKPYEARLLRNQAPRKYDITIKPKAAHRQVN
jgi:hypothetical protein